MSKQEEQTQSVLTPNEEFALKKQLETEARRLEFFKRRVRIIPAQAARCKAQGCWGRRGWTGVDFKNGTLILCCGDLGDTQMTHIEDQLSQVISYLQDTHYFHAWTLPVQMWRWCVRKFKKHILRKAE